MRVGGMWKGTEDTEETRDVESVDSLGTWSISVEKRRLRQKGSRKEGCTRTGWSH